MKVVAIVQARLSSSRFPRKVLETLGAATVLDQVMKRCAAMKTVDEVWCATVAGPEGDPIQRVASQWGRTYLGSRLDVLGRYHEAAAKAKADLVVRVTSDCPLFDPAVGDKLVQSHSRLDEIVVNNSPSTWPHGLDAEVIPVNLLARAAAVAKDAFDREHVTPWLRREPDVVVTNVVKEYADDHHLRWTVDYPEDLEYLRGLFEAVPELEHNYDHQLLIDRINSDESLSRLTSEFLRSHDSRS